MVLSFLIGVFDEEHIVDQAHEGVFHALVLIVLLLLGEICRHLGLRVDIGLQAVSAVDHIIQETLLRLGGVASEEIAEHPLHDQRIGVQVHVNPKIIVGAHLVGMERHRRIEDSEQAMDRVHRNLPYTEESEDMVDAVSVEILRHLAEARFPPCEAVAAHLLPVVGGESPVLSQHGEVVRGRSGLAVHIEQARVDPRVGACAADADGYVALEDHAMVVGVVAHLTQLFVEEILDEVDILHLRLVGFDELLDLRLVVERVVAPLAHVGGAVLVAQHAERRVWLQPIKVGFKECLV